MSAAAKIAVWVSCYNFLFNKHCFAKCRFRFFRMNHPISDTRPYATVKSKNHLLFLLDSYQNAEDKADKFTAQQALIHAIDALLIKAQLLPLSVALSLVKSSKEYRILIDSLEQVLLAKNQETQYLVFPFILVATTQQEIKLNLSYPQEQWSALIRDCLPRQWQSLTFTTHLLSAEQLSNFTALNWYHAKYNPSVLSVEKVKKIDSWQINQKTQILLAFVLGNIKQMGDIIVPPFIDNPELMRLMYFWIDFFKEKKINAFVNPLSPMTPLTGLIHGVYMRNKMALELYAAQAIYSLKLNHQPVAVVIASRLGGSLEIDFQSIADSTLHFNYSWQLLPADCLDQIIDELCQLLDECKVDRQRLLKLPLDYEEPIPTYEKALQQDGISR